MTRGLLFIVLLGCFLGYPIMSHGGSTLDPLKKMRERFDGLSTLSANFVRGFQWKLAKKEQTFKGKMLLKKPNMFRFDTRDHVVSTDGESVWNFVRANNQVIINKYAAPQKDRTPESLLFNLLFQEGYVRGYTSLDGGTEKLDGKACRVIVLTALKDEAYITSIQIWIVDRTSLPSRIEYIDFNEDITTYRLSKFKLDRKIPDETFRFTPPAEVEVVDFR